MKQPLPVQILLSTHNGARFLTHQLETLRPQDYPEISILIRDDGSDDDTLQIIEEYCSKRQQFASYSDQWVLVAAPVQRIHQLWERTHRNTSPLFLEIFHVFSKRLRRALVLVRQYELRRNSRSGCYDFAAKLGMIPAEPGCLPPGCQLPGQGVTALSLEPVQGVIHCTSPSSPPCSKGGQVGF